jgi:hypothetical protein
MTRDDAEQLAVKIHQTWPRGIAAHIWEEELAQLDSGRANTAYVRLRRTEQHPPTIPRFLAEYNQLDTTDPRPAHDHCDHCANTGDIATIDHDPAGNYLGTTVAPCHCPWGNDRRQIHARIIEHNTRELDRLHPDRHHPTRSTL